MVEESFVERMPGAGVARPAPTARHEGAADESSWLCRDAGERARVLDMDRRIAPVRRTALGVLAVAAVLQAHWLGLWTLLPLFFAAVSFAVGAKLSARAERPEYVLFGAWVFAEGVIAATAAIAGIHAGLLAWLAIPVITLSARFSLRGVLTGLGVGLAMMVGVAFGTDAAAVLDYPPLLIAPAAVLVSVGVLSTALMRSDVEHRDEAVIDQLTGMLNRNALVRRADELEQQSAVTGEPIAVVIGDLDRFKDVNDSLGHAAGDAVLTDVAYVIRKQLRAFDLAYRLGGEEFLILIPGADLESATRLAERMRRAVAAEPLGDSEVTISFGVSATRHGERFDYEAVFARADAALYAAKRDGRDRVDSSAP